MHLFHQFFHREGLWTCNVMMHSSRIAVNGFGMISGLCPLHARSARVSLWDGLDPCPPERRTIGIAIEATWILRNGSSFRKIQLHECAVCLHLCEMFCSWDLGHSSPRSNAARQVWFGGGSRSLTWFDQWLKKSSLAFWYVCDLIGHHNWFARFSPSRASRFATIHRNAFSYFWVSHGLLWIFRFKVGRNWFSLKLATRRRKRW